MRIYTDYPYVLIRDDGLNIPKSESNIDYQMAISEVAASKAKIVVYVPTKSDKKQTALATVGALGFSLDQLRVIRAVVLLSMGNTAQKVKAQAMLAPLLKIVTDAKAISDAIDSDAVPPDFVSPIIPTDDP